MRHPAPEKEVWDCVRADAPSVTVPSSATSTAPGFTDEFSAETQAAWFSRMADYVRSIDGFNHPISTSFGSGRVYPEVWQLRSADFSMMH